MLYLSGAIYIRMNFCDVGGRQYQSLIYRLDLRCTTMDGRRASMFLSCIVMSLRTPVSPDQYCCVMGGVGERGSRLLGEQPRNHYLVQFSVHRDRVMAATLGAFSMMTWRKTNMLSQYVAMISVSCCSIAS